MTLAARPIRLLTLALALLLTLALLIGGAAPAPAAAASDSVEAAKLKRCKKGWNKKKCRCPANKRRVKKNKRYRCKKKAAAPQQNEGTTTVPNPTDPNTTTGTDPNTTTGVQPPADAQAVRDDAAFEAALSSTSLRRYEEGTYGYGRYAYNFLSDHQLLYCSYYYAGSTVEGNRVGTWQVVEGYRVPAVPGYTAGKVRITGSDFDVLMVVEMLGDRSNVETGNASNVFTEGSFSRVIGGAVTNCSAIS